MESIREIYRAGHGPSSSHTMGPGRAAAQFLARHPTAARFAVELFGSLAATGRGHLTDRVILDTLNAERTDIVWSPERVLPHHPNAMTFTAWDGSEQMLESWTTYSVGGGALRDDADWDVPPASAYPLSAMDDILGWSSTTGGVLWEFVELHEGAQVWTFLAEVWAVMKESMARGLEAEGRLPGTLGLQRKAASYLVKATNSSAFFGEVGRVFAYALAVSEENAAGGEVVTAPTCGSAGVLPAALKFLEDTYDFSEQRMLRALATAGLVGSLVKNNASLSGAEVGCQGEIGTACAMAAAAVTQLLGGSVQQIEHAAEAGIEHHLGLTCDPVEGYVQIPCIERNAVAAGRALQAATFAIFAAGQHRISFDEVVLTMKETGADMCANYKETSRSGLAKNWQQSEARSKERA